MTPEHQKILNAIEAELKRNPDLRFGQALFNLQINLFVTPKNPEASDHRMRDIHGDSDKDILRRIEERLSERERQRRSGD